MRKKLRSSLGLFRVSVRSMMLLTSLVAILVTYAINCGPATYWWFTHRQDPTVNSLLSVELRNVAISEPFSAVRLGNLYIELPTVLAENWSVVPFGKGGRRLRFGSKDRFVDFSIGAYQSQRDIFKKAPIEIEELTIPEVYRSLYDYSTNEFSLLMSSHDLVKHEAMLGTRRFFGQPNLTEYYFLDKADVQVCCAFSSTMETYYTFAANWEHISNADGGFFYINDGRASCETWVNRALNSLRYLDYNGTTGLSANAEDSEIERVISISPLTE